MITTVKVVLAQIKGKVLRFGNSYFKSSNFAVLHINSCEGLTNELCVLPKEKIIDRFQFNPWELLSAKTSC